MGVWSAVSVVAGVLFNVDSGYWGWTGSLRGVGTILYLFPRTLYTSLSFSRRRAPSGFVTVSGQRQESAPSMIGINELTDVKIRIVGIIPSYILAPHDIHATQCRHCAK